MSANGKMTIEELSARSGVTTRNIRAFQSRGLLPSPKTVHRTGYYDDGHLARLRLILGMQKRGFSLASIHELLGAWEQGRGLDEVLGFESALTAKWHEKEGLYTRQELVDLLGVELDDDVLERGTELGLIEAEGKKYRVRYPRVLAVAAKGIRAGVPVKAGVDELAEIIGDAERAADRFVRLYVDHFWRPFAEHGMPADGLVAMTQALEELRQVGLELMNTALEETLEDAIEATTAKYFKPLEDASRTGSQSR